MKIELDDDLWKCEKTKNVCYISLDGWDYQFSFKEIYENQYYTVIDKEHLGEKIRKELLNEYGTFDEFYDKLNGGYDEEFVDEVLTKIEEDVVNKIRNEICEYILFDCLSEYC